MSEDTPLSNANSHRTIDLLVYAKDEEEWVPASVARDLERRLCALAIHTIAMCKWCETMADKLGWDRENAGAIWASHDAARAAALAADRQEPAPDEGAG